MTASRHLTKEQLSQICSEARKKFYANGGVHPKGMLGKTAWNKGKKLSYEVWNKGKIGTFKHTQEWKDMMSKRMENFKHTPETIAKISKAHTGVKMPQITGPNNYHWNPNRTALLESFRLKGSIEWKVWRGQVFERDKYTCQECGRSGVYLEPHHIIPIRSDKSKVFELINGITLCRPCHLKTIWKESNFAEKYSALVAAH